MSDLMKPESIGTNKQKRFVQSVWPLIAAILILLSAASCQNLFRGAADLTVVEEVESSPDPDRVAGPVVSDTTTIVLLHDNDLHFSYSHRELFEARVAQIRETYDNVFLLNAGDTFVRHAHRWAEPDTSYYRDRSRWMIETMNEVGYDASAVGNHEIDYVGEHSGESLKRAGFPLLGANILIDTPNLPQLKPYTVLQTDDGYSIAVIGHSTVNFDKPGVRERDPVDVTREHLDLADEHDLFVALTHIGYSNDVRLASEVPELDVIIGGHSHTLLEEARLINDVLIAQAGGPPPEHQINPEWPKFLGKVKIKLVDGEVVGKSGTVTRFGPEGEYYTQTAHVPADTSPDEVVELSGRVLPHSRQLMWFEDAFFGFIHFGPNTFTGEEWGDGNESPQLFDPAELDVDQWVRTMKAAGMRRVVVVAKHHEGFALWQTRYTDHSVASSPWRNGEGDLIAELAESVREHGLRLGIYLSPADLYQIESEGGYYGNESEFTERQIPRPVEGRPFDDERTFTYQVDDYNEYFLNQLYELLTEYGPVHEVWFDGANPRPGTGQTYTYDAWYDMIRHLAPDAAIFGKGPDARWVGNEGGRTREAEYNVIPLPMHPDEFDWPDMMQEDVAGRDQITGETRYLHYYPAETNTSIRHGWFWRNDDEQQVRTADDVFDIYERSVGGNSVFHLNIPPNDKGLFSEHDVEVLEETGRRIEQVYGNDLMDGAVAAGRALDETSGETDSVEAVFDGSGNTWWQAPTKQAQLTVELPEPREVNRFMAREAIAHRGERVESHTLEARVDGEWRQVAEGKTIGHKRILRFPAVLTDAFRLSINEARMPAGISHISAHFYDEPPKPVVIRRDDEGRVTLGVGTSFDWNDHGTADQSQPIYYTLDGSEPTIESTRYEVPFELPEGGLLKARAIVGEQAGPVGERYVGMDPEGWRVRDSDSLAEDGWQTIGADRNDSSRSGTDAPESLNGRVEGKPANAFDGISDSHWICCSTDDVWKLEVDLGRSVEIAGFSYIPARGSGYLESYAIEVSLDGDQWHAVHEDRFGNIINDPSRRIVRFESSQQVRFIRFTDLNPAGEADRVGASDIELLPGRSE